MPGVQQAGERRRRMIINIPLQIDDATIQGQISKDDEKKIKDIKGEEDG